MNGSLAPIADLYKTEVYGLARYINRVAAENGDIEPIPEPIIAKAPSAELRYNQKDQDTLPEYEVLDKILQLYIEENLSMDQIVNLGFDRGDDRQSGIQAQASRTCNQGFKESFWLGSTAAACSCSARNRISISSAMSDITPVAPWSMK